MIIINLITYGILLMGSFIAAIISGAAGFGGALLLLPILTYCVGVDLAVPLLTLAQIFSNLSRMYFGFKYIKWRPVLLFVTSAIPAAVVGAYSFIKVSNEIATKIMGVAIIIFVLLKFLKIISFKPNSMTLFIGGIVVGFISGLVGSAGPINALLFLSLQLTPIAYIASEATTAFIIHIVKIIIYEKYIGYHLHTIFIGLLMGVFMIGGTWLGKKIIEKLPKKLFIDIVSILLILIGIQMIIWG